MNKPLAKEKFSLQSFPLCLGSMLEFKVDVKGLVSLLAKAYPIMHWGAGIGGDGIEFVLGSYAVQNGNKPAQGIDFPRQSHTLFLWTLANSRR